MTPKERELEKENAKLKEQIAGLQRRVQELESQKPASKSRQQAEAALELLKKGPVSKEQLLKINPKYPSDCIYYVKNILKQPVVRHKNFYMLPEHYEVLKAKQEEEKAATAVQAQVEPKEAVPQAQASA
jgi:hypothetical protein